MHDRHVKVPDEVAAHLVAALRDRADLRPETGKVYQEILTARRGQGWVTVFGNQGALFRNAMTWWDHGTDSVWSQVWGRAILGPLRGTALAVLSASIAPWQTWKEEHPGTLALDEDGPRIFRERPTDRFVIGITLAGHARGFHFAEVKRLGVVNDAIGPHPVVVYVHPQTRSISVFLRRLGDRTLTFGLRDGLLVDHETGSRWHPRLGLAQTGPLAGESLKPLAYVPAFPFAWQDFYPDTT